MEKLKPRAEVLLPDVRYLNRVNVDHSTGVVSDMTIDTIYEELQQIQLNPTVPESVRSHFEIARNLAVYSWFVYAFNVVAAMQAFASLEMAVKERPVIKEVVLRASWTRSSKADSLSADSLHLLIYRKRYRASETIWRMEARLFTAKV